MDGTAILTVMTMETAASAQQAAQVEKQQAERQQAQDRSITSVRGLGGLIGRRMAKRKAEPESAASGQPQTPGRATLLTSTHELVKVSTALSPHDLTIPAGFKEKR